MDGYAAMAAPNPTSDACRSGTVQYAGRSVFEISPMYTAITTAEGRAAAIDNPIPIATNQKQQIPLPTVSSPSLQLQSGALLFSTKNALLNHSHRHKSQSTNNKQQLLFPSL